MREERREKWRKGETNGREGKRKIGGKEGQEGREK